MIIDSSAILAVIFKEHGYERIVHELATSPATRIGAPAKLEAGIVLTARLGPRGKTVLARFLQENSVETLHLRRRVPRRRAAALPGRRLPEDRSSAGQP
jgi:ribonuclease VapC